MSESSEEELEKENNDYCEQSDWDTGSDSETKFTQCDDINFKEEKAFDLYLK